MGVSLLKRWHSPWHHRGLAAGIAIVLMLLLSGSMLGTTTLDSTTSTPKFVQSSVEAGSGTTLRLTLSYDVHSGSLLTGMFRTDAGTEVSDNLNGRWTRAASSGVNSLWYLTDAKAGGTTVSVTATRSGPVRADVAEYMGIKLSDALAGASCNASSTGTVATTGNAANILAGRLDFIGLGTFTHPLTVTAGRSNGAAAILRNQLSGAQGTEAIEDALPPPGNQDGSFKLSGNADWVACIAAFRPRVTSTPPTPTPTPTPTSKPTPTPTYTPTPTPTSRPTPTPTPTSTPTPTPSPTGSGGSVIWSADGIGAIYQEWQNIDDRNSCSASTSPANAPDSLIQLQNPAGAPAPRGTAYHFTLPANDTSCYAGRTELAQGDWTPPGQTDNKAFYPGDNVWLAWNVYFPADYPLNNPSIDWGGGMMQIHQNGGCNTPPFGLTFSNSNHLSLYYTNSPTDCPVVNKLNTYLPLDPSTPFKPNQWYRIMLHVNFEDTGNGSVAAYLDMNDGQGMQLRAQTGPINTIYSNALPSHARVGALWDSGNPSHPGWDLYVADFTVATSAAAAEANAFGSAGP
jgi:outer membrane biosynthesis protein TonB